MEHRFFDKYSNLSSPIHKLSIEIKVVLFIMLSIIILTFFEKSFWLYVIFFPVLILVIKISKIPISFFIKRISVISPLLFLISLSMVVAQKKDIMLILKLVFNSVYIITLLILLVETTKFLDLLKKFNDWRIPEVIIKILSFIYRYSYILVDEIERFLRAYKVRCNKKMNLKIVSSILTMILIRSYERAEKIYFSMMVRTFK